MEKAKGKKNSTKSGEHSLAGLSEPASEEAREKQKASGEPKLQKTSASGTKRKRSMKEDKEKKEEGSGKVRLRKKIPVPPLPSKLPPANMLHRDVLRAWCQQLKLSTKGQKLDVYKRICEYAYPDQQKNIPVTAEEAKILSESQRRSKMEQGEMSLEGFGKRMLCLPPGPELQAGLARWRPWNRHRRPTESCSRPRMGRGVRWCVVHGKSLPADTEGWVHLQFHAGQAWVPEKRGRVCALFLLPACNFPPPHLEDNMLCPRCVRRNKVLMKSLQ
ncbi:developmental pluripotency-associated protein 4 isoform X3 [Neovison vison]|uniref:developmental pluripotency-associated protein 4 isoform X3 n=1 Tax=Neovison vison TaxID=452646 RepID=UPI001CF04FF4|nr:developmental pluripotency-associated protein 4 isoform X3 [Neogale vison]